MAKRAPIYTYTTRAKVVLALAIIIVMALLAWIADHFNSPIPIYMYVVVGIFIYYFSIARAAPFGDRLRVKVVLGKRREYFVSQGTFSLESKPSLIASLLGSPKGLRIVYTQEGKHPVVVMNELFSEKVITEIYEFMAYSQNEYHKNLELEGAVA